jgi:hypothetical protein
MVSGIAACLMASCAMVTGMISEDKLPAPLKALVVQLKGQQKVVEQKYTAATALMISAYKDLAESVKLKKEAAELEVYAKAMEASSGGLEEARKIVKRAAPLIEKVQKKIAAADFETFQSAEHKQSGFRKRGEAYQLRVKLLAESLLHIADAAVQFKQASPMEKAMLTTKLDPFYFMVRDYKNFKEREQQFETALAEIRKRDASIPQLPRVVEPAKLDLKF